jgi:hypothetical protein
LNDSRKSKFRSRLFSAGLALSLSLMTAALPAQARLARLVMLNYENEILATDESYLRSIESEIRMVDSYGLADIETYVFVRGESANASSDGGQVIFLPRTLVMEDGMYNNRHYKHMPDLLAVFSHEYGHQVFSDIMMRRVPGFLNLHTLDMQISQLLLQSIEPGLTREQRAHINKQINDIHVRIAADPRLRAMANITLPYNELFADVIAVYAHNNKSAIYNALWFPNMHTGSEEFVEARDFSREHSLASWRHTEVHILFSPFRSLIGHSRCWPRNFNEAKEKLNQLADLLVEDITIQLEKNETPPISKNGELMERFRTLCR